MIQSILDEHILGSSGLDYAAYVVSTPKGIEVTAEARNESQLRDLLWRLGFGKRSVQEQIDLWKAVMAKVHEHMLQLDREFARTGQGGNIRVVFDLDMGGVFYTRLGVHAFVFGASLDQAEVNSGSCELEMKKIVEDIGCLSTIHG